MVDSSPEQKLILCKTMMEHPVEEVTSLEAWSVEISMKKENNTSKELWRVHI